MKLVASNVINEIMNDEWIVCSEKKRKHTVGLEPTISCSVGKRLIQLGYACLFASCNIDYFKQTSINYTH